MLTGASVESGARGAYLAELPLMVDRHDNISGGWMSTKNSVVCLKEMIRFLQNLLPIGTVVSISQKASTCARAFTAAVVATLS